MTLANCQRLLKHFNKLIDGTIPEPIGHKNWADVIYNAKVRAKAMEKTIEYKLSRYPELKTKVEPKIKEVKKDGSRSNRN